MFFKLLPSIEYTKSPISYPFSESDYIIAKNFFKKYVIDENIFQYAVYFDKYVIQTGERLDTIAQKFYKNPFYDWVIAITNNMVNPGYDLPMDDNAIRIYAEDKYDDAYSGTHHYETVEYKTIKDVVLQPAGLYVDENFYNSTHTFNNGASLVTIPGSTLSRPVNNYEYETQKNEKNREIYILQPALLEAFVSSFKKSNKYIESSDYINKNLKKTNRI
jgi:hypothetical protein